MLRTLRSRLPSSGLALALAGIVFAPLGIASASPARFADPAVPDWTVASGYGSVESNRAVIAPRCKTVLDHSATDVNKELP